MEKVTGIGGIFFKARDPERMSAWYREHLGICSEDGHADFIWREQDRPDEVGRTVWSVFPLDTDYFGPTGPPFMVNYRVADLQGLLEALRGEGCNVLEKTDDSAYGKFGWVIDPEGNKVELWQPPEGQ